MAIPELPRINSLVQPLRAENAHSEAGQGAARPFGSWREGIASKSAGTLSVQASNLMSLLGIGAVDPREATQEALPLLKLPAV